MPKPKLNSKKHLPSIRSNSPKRIITFHNSINDIINKFENSQKIPNGMALDIRKSIKNPGKLQNYCDNFSIYSNQNFSSARLNRKNQRLCNNSAINMVDSIGDEVVVDSDRSSPDHTHVDEAAENYDESDTFDDPNEYEYMPASEPIIAPTKFMRLRNINIVQCQLNIVQRFVGILLNLPFLWSINGAGLSTLTCAFFLPRILCENILYPVFRLIFGTLYPAYASYKAVRHKDVKEYVSTFEVFIFDSRCHQFDLSSVLAQMDYVLDRFRIFYML